MRLIRGSASAPAPRSALSISEVARRLPDDVRESTRRWFFNDVPLHRPEHATSLQSLARAPLGTVLRFAGVITELEQRSGAAVLRPYDEGGPRYDWPNSAADFRFHTNLGEHARKIDMLRGLILDVDMQVEGEYASGAYPASSIVAVHGIERQITNDSHTGVVRGEVARVTAAEHDWVVGDVLSEGNTTFRVHLPERDMDDVWSEGNVVAARVTRGGFNGAGTYSQDRFAGQPLEPAILLQAAPLRTVVVE